MGSYNEGFIGFGLEFSFAEASEGLKIPKEIRVMYAGMRECEPTTVVLIKKSVVTDDMSCADFNPASLIVQPEWLKILEDFCTEHDLKYENPKWLLGSFYG